MNDAKVRRAAALLIERDGPRALDVAMRRAKSCASRRDREGAKVWTIIAEEIAAMMDHVSTTSLPRPEPRLDDVLESSTTKAVMDADRVRRRDLDSIIRRVRDKLGRE